VKRMQGIFPILLLENRLEKACLYVCQRLLVVDCLRVLLEGLERGLNGSSEHSRRLLGEGPLEQESIDVECRLLNRIVLLIYIFDSIEYRGSEGEELLQLFFESDVWPLERFQ